MAEPGDFLQRLRMANLFPANHTGGQTYGMPDLNAGNDQVERMRRFNQEPEGVQNFGPVDIHGNQNLPKIDAYTGPGQVKTENTKNILFDATAGMGRITPYQSGQLDVARQRLDMQRDLGEQKLDQAGTGLGIRQQNTDISRQRAAIADFKAKNPSMKVLAPKGGNYSFVNPVTGDVVDSGISTGTFTDEENLRITGEQSMARIDRQGELQSGLQDKRGNQALDQIGARIKGQQELQDTRPLLPSQQRAQHGDNIQRLMMSNPDLAQYVVEDEQGNIRLSVDTPPEAKRAIEQFVYPSRDIGLPAGNTNTPAVQPEKPKAPQSKYKVTVE